MNSPPAQWEVFCQLARLFPRLFPYVCLYSSGLDLPAAKKLPVCPAAFPFVFFRRFARSFTRIPPHPPAFHRIHLHSTAVRRIHPPSARPSSRLPHALPFFLPKFIFFSGFRAPKHGTMKEHAIAMLIFSIFQEELGHSCRMVL
jgi:hypothetical protein